MRVGRYRHGDAHPRVILVMGVAGSGKSTIGRALAEALGRAFEEGDDHHPAENVAKMSSGIPLTDGDRTPWLESLRLAIDESIGRGEPIVVACSALKQSYREQLFGHNDVTVVYLRGDPDLFRDRLRNRSGHYMKSEMLDSQIEALEEPKEAIVIDAEQDPESIVDTILGHLIAVSQRQSKGP